VFDLVNQNSGVFVRFRDPALDPTPVIQQRLQAVGHADLFRVNRAWGAVHSGFEIQNDDRAALRRNRTGAIYDIPAGDGAEANQQNYQPGPILVPGRWYEYVIDVRNNRYRVDLRDLDTMVQVRTADYNNADVDRGIALVNGNPAGYIGLQSYNSAPVAFRRIDIRP
jgi:hypothetical protein